MKLNKLSHASRIIGAFIVLGLFLTGILLVTPQMTYQLDPAWSPDGNYVAFECHYSYLADRYDPAKWDNPVWYQETGEICLIDMETRKFKRLTYGRHKVHPAWSLDGRQLAWYDKQKGLVSYDLQSHTTTSNAEFPYDFENQTGMSPDGRYFVELLNVSDQEPYQGFKFVIRENDKKIFESDFRIIPNPSWSDDSSLLALIKFRENEGEQDVVFIHFPAMEMTSIKVTHPISAISWSSRGSRLALQSDEILEIIDFKFEKNPFSCLVLKKRTFQLHGIVNEDISWSPDGRYIVFMSQVVKEKLSADAYTATPEQLWLLDLESGMQAPVIGKP